MIINPYMFPGGGPTGPTLVANTFADANGSGNTPSSVATTGINTTGSNLIVVGVSLYTGGGGTVTAVTDSEGNTWVPLTQQSNGFLGWQFYYCASPSVGSGHIFTVAGVFIYHSVFVGAFSGLSASPFDVENGASSGGSSTLSTGSVTPAVANSLAVTGVSHGDNSLASVTVNGGYSQTDSDPYVPGVVGGSMAWQVVNAATNPQWNITNSASIAAAIAVFAPV